MTPGNEEIDLIATKLGEAYHGNLSNYHILLDARDMLLALKARAEAAEKRIRELEAALERIVKLDWGWRGAGNSAEKTPGQYARIAHAALDEAQQ